MTKTMQRISINQQIEAERVTNVPRYEEKYFTPDKADLGHKDKVIILWNQQVQTNRTTLTINQTS
jgi:hypothetical protein